MPFSPLAPLNRHCTAVQYAECSGHRHNTQLHGLITDRSVEFTFSPLKVSENSRGLTGLVEGAKVRLAPRVEPGLVTINRINTPH